MGFNFFSGLELCIWQCFQHSGHQRQQWENTHYSNSLFCFEYTLDNRVKWPSFEPPCSVLFDFAVAGTVLKYSVPWLVYESVVLLRCDAMLTLLMLLPSVHLPVCLSVCPSFTIQYCIKVAAYIITHSGITAVLTPRMSVKNPTAFFSTPPVLTQAQYSICVLNVLLNTIHPTVALCIRAVQCTWPSFVPVLLFLFVLYACAALASFRHQKSLSCQIIAASCSVKFSSHTSVLAPISWPTIAYANHPPVTKCISIVSQLMIRTDDCVFFECDLLIPNSECHAESKTKFLRNKSISTMAPSCQNVAVKN